MSTIRYWYPSTLSADGLTRYRVSFLIAEEATWDHRFHDLDGNELDPGDLCVPPSTLEAVQSICDGIVGAALHVSCATV